MVNGKVRMLVMGRYMTGFSITYRNHRPVRCVVKLDA